MSAINLWNWRYEISLYPEMKRQVENEVYKLQPEYKNLYINLINYYYSFISFDIILNALEPSTTKNFNELGFDELSILRKKIKYIPTLIRKNQKRRMEYVCEINPQFSEILNDLFKQGCRQTKNLDYSYPFKIMFGKYFNEILSYTQQLEKLQKNEKQEKIHSSKLMEFINSTIKKATNDLNLHKRFGEYSNLEYKIEITERNGGYAEWWARELSDEDKDKLVIIKNQNTLNKDDLELTLYHEVYPGHGHFYDAARRQRKHPFFDHGALCLIEGWATYCEWNTVNSDYASYLRSNAGAYFKLLDRGKDIDELLYELFKKQLKHNTEKQALYAITYFSEYPGFNESYFMGAYWLDYKINIGDFSNPVDFLEFLSVKPWGDFFALW
ncbi:hypothetical protein HNQ94_000046 [Salirhabdus euzebyi]|uniref:DUF885 family protein n=1 Tax=Salirhabdus euzebyi TaxID=394506 RepID=A0A841Q1H5_9BACI|nr:DUF885 family protein [Salirhabdus euzebyi]MBB6451625.1 hypothetical protein [Salirhabdus euzebyi]